MCTLTNQNTVFVSSRGKAIFGTSFILYSIKDFFLSVRRRFYSGVHVLLSLRSLEQFRTRGFLRIESTAVQRCARKSILKLHRDQTSLARAGGDGMEFLSETGFHA